MEIDRKAVLVLSAFSIPFSEQYIKEHLPIEDLPMTVVGSTVSYPMRLMKSKDKRATFTTGWNNGIWGCGCGTVRLDAAAGGGLYATAASMRREARPARDGGRHSALDETGAAAVSMRLDAAAPAAPAAASLWRQPRRVDAMAPRRENRLDTAAPGKLRCNGDAAIRRCAKEVGGTDELPIGRVGSH
uniref:Uncharacterized protein n=1 Tax=Oryza meridionalis TaxID=40149 RepID=A0A0E0FAN5_9ORYZ